MLKFRYRAYEIVVNRSYYYKQIKRLRADYYYCYLFKYSLVVFYVRPLTVYSRILPPSLMVFAYKSTKSKWLWIAWHCQQYRHILMGPNVETFDNSLLCLEQFRLQKTMNQFEGLASGKGSCGKKQITRGGVLRSVPDVQYVADIYKLNNTISYDPK